ncbi:MAG: hemolysin III family protein [Chloroflexota bacterium]
MQRFREPVNGFTHLAGAVLSAMGLIWLVIITANNTPKMMSLVIYGVSMILLYAASATFHLIKTTPEKLLWLRRFDHAAIYLLIAGTYTPLFYNLLEGSFRWWLLVVVWIVALAGAAYKLFFLQDSGLLSLACYVIVGSIGVVSIPQTLRVLPSGAIILIAIGVFFYLIGVVVFGLEKPNFYRYFGYHEIWHLLVMAGSFIHFIAILLYIA